MKSCKGQQRGWEFEAWIALCRAWRVWRYAEIGWGTGETAQYARDQLGGPVVSVSLDLGPSGGPRTGIAYITADGADPDAVLRAVGHLTGEPDAVFIDGNHEYAHVKADFEAWWPVTRTMLAFHDVDMTHIQSVGAAQFWAEVSKGIPSLEICSRDVAAHEATRVPGGGEPAAGIGILFKVQAPFDRVRQ